MKKLVLLFAVVVLVTPQLAFAESGQNAGSKKDVLIEHKEALMEKKTMVKEAMAETKADRKAAMADKKAAFKAKLQTLKDENKKMLAEKLDTKLDTINKTRTDKMTENITKLTAILEKLKTTRDAEKTEGHDVTAVNTAITSAETALKAAQTAIDAQATKDYTAQVTDETTLKKNFGSVVSQLRTDLSTVHKTVVDAKQAVKDVAKALKALEGGATVSPAISPVVTP